MPVFLIRLNGILLTLCLLSCTSNQAPIAKQNDFNWSRDSMKNYYLQHIAPYKILDTENSDSLWYFNVFAKHVLKIKHAKNAFDHLIYALDEPYIDTTQIPVNKQWLRISVNPTFYVPYCLVLEKTYNNSTLTLKTTNGRGGSNIGYLDMMTKNNFSSEMYDSISTQLNRLNFEQLPENRRCRTCTDGEEWTIEWIENGKYKIHFMDSPYYNKYPQDSVLSLMVTSLRNHAKFKQMIALKTGQSMLEINQQYLDKINQKRD